MADEFGSAREFIALDLETTGLSAARDRIVELAAVRFRETGETIDLFQSLVNPERPVSPGAYAVHGLSDQELAQAPPARVVLPKFLSFLGGSGCVALIAHNSCFDAGFLGSELRHRGSTSLRLPCTTHWRFRERGCRCWRAIVWIRSPGTSGSIQPGLTARWQTRFSSRKSGCGWAGIASWRGRSRFGCLMLASRWRFRKDGKRSSKLSPVVSRSGSNTKAARAARLPGLSPLAVWRAEAVRCISSRTVISTPLKRHSASTAFSRSNSRPRAASRWFVLNVGPPVDKVFIVTKQTLPRPCSC